MGEKGIVSLLLADADVAALVGTRIAPAITSQTLAKPNIVYQRIASSRVKSQDGPTGSAECLLQVSMYASTYKGAKTLADKVRIAIDGYKGTAGGIVIDACFIEDEDDMPQPPDAGDESGVFGIRQDYRLHFQESY